MESWLLLHTKPHKEDMLAAQIRSRKIECFFPKLMVQTKNRRAKRSRPYFPGYLFVKLEPGSQWAYELKWLPGIVDWVRFGADHATVTEAVISSIRRQVDRANAECDEAQETIKKGTRLRVVRGPLAGYEGVFDARLSGSDRVRVLLKMVRSQKKKAEMPAGYLQVINQY